MTAPVPWVPKCPLCLRGNWRTNDQMIAHVAGHTPRTIAQSLNTVMRREHALKNEVHVLRYGVPVNLVKEPTELPCANKEAFDTEYQATRALLSAWAKSSVDPRRHETRTYSCSGPRGCGKWHVTSQEKTGA